MRQRGAQVGKQVAEHLPGLRRFGLGQELHRSQRIEQEMRLDLRLHELELRFDRLLGQQIAVGLGLEQVGARARLAELKQEEKADEKPLEKPLESGPAELVAGRVISSTSV